MRHHTNGLDLAMLCGDDAIEEVELSWLTGWIGSTSLKRPGVVKSYRNKPDAAGEIDLTLYHATNSSDHMQKMLQTVIQDLTGIILRLPNLHPEVIPEKYSADTINSICSNLHLGTSSVYMIPCSATQPDDTVVIVTELTHVRELNISLLSTKGEVAVRVMSLLRALRPMDTMNRDGSSVH